MALSSSRPTGGGGPALTPKWEEPSGQLPGLQLPAQVSGERLAGRFRVACAHREAGRGARVSVTDFFHGKFCSRLIPCAVQGPQDTGKMPGGMGKAESLETFLTPGLGQSQGGSSEEKGFWALQTSSSRLVLRGCGQGL